MTTKDIPARDQFPTPQGIIIQSRTTRAHALGLYAGKLAGFVRARVIDPLRASFRRRKMVNDLNALDDRILNDIGLRRSDISRLAKEAFNGVTEEKAPFLDIRPADFRWEIKDAKASVASNDGRDMAA